MFIMYTLYFPLPNLPFLISTAPGLLDDFVCAFIPCQCQWDILLILVTYLRRLCALFCPPNNRYRYIYRPSRRRHRRQNPKLRPPGLSRAIPLSVPHIHPPFPLTLPPPQPPPPRNSPPPPPPPANATPEKHPPFVT